MDLARRRDEARPKALRVRESDAPPPLPPPLPPPPEEPGDGPVEVLRDARVEEEEEDGVAAPPAASLERSGGSCA